MRSCSTALAAWLDSTTSTERPRHLVTVTLRSGTVYRWTDHTADLVVGGSTFYAGGQGTTHPIVKVGRSSQLAGLDIASLSLALECGDAALLGTKRLPLAAAQRAFDGATVKVERIFLAATSIASLADRTLHWFEGLVGEVTPASTRVEVEVESGVAALSVEIPRRRFTPGCSNVLFDGQCGLLKASWTATARVVAAGATTQALSATSPEATGWFDLGVLTFTSGACAGEVRAVRSYVLSGGTGSYTLDRPLPVAPSAGDTFDVYPGCDKRLATCQTKFGDNSARFAGFPSIPREGPVPSPSSVGSVARAVAGLPPLPPTKEARTYGESMPLAYGKSRLPAKPIFVGAASGNPPIADVLSALCEGPITAVDRIFYEGAVAAAAAGVAGISTFASFTGTRPTQTPWSRLPAGKALGYPGTAMVGETVQLDGGRPPEREWEGRWRLSGTGGSDGDAHPTQIVRDVLGRDPTTGAAKAHDPYGAQFPFPVEMAAGLDGNAASSFTRWVEQNAFWLSPTLDTRKPARDWLEEICEATNAEPCWKEGYLGVYPRGDAAVGTFTPVTAVRYTLTRTDLIGGDDGGPVTMELSPEADARNVCPVTFRERSPDGVAADPSLAYQETTEQDPEPVNVAARGERPAGAVSLLGVTNRAHALKISRMMAQRASRARRALTGEVPVRFCRLQPLDLITVSDDLLPLNLEPMQIREIEENPETRTLRFTAVHWEGGVNFATAHVTASSDGATTPYEPNRTEEINTVRLVAVDAAGDASTALTKADQALALAGSNTRVYHQASPPSTTDLPAGSLWFSTDTTTACPVSGCKGHTLDGDGAPLVGSYPHRGIYWPHRWSGTAWEDVERQALVVASEIATGAIVADKIAANAVVAEKIAASAVRTDHLAVGGQNLLRNADLSALRRFGASLTDPTHGDIWLEGWDVRNLESRPCTVGINNAAEWTLFGDTNVTTNPGGNTGFIWQSSAYLDGSRVYGVASDRVPVVAGDYYMASVYTGALRCEGRVSIHWYDAASAYLSTSEDTGASGRNVAEASGGTALAGYKRIYRKAQAPAGAAFAVLMVYKFDTLSGASPADSYLFFARPMLEEVDAAQAAPSRWVNSGITLIDGGRISAGSIRTSNYAEDANGNATAGAKLDHVGTALKVAPGNLQIGARDLTSLGVVMAAGHLVNTSSTRYLYYAQNIASVTRVAGTPPYLQFAFTNLSASFALFPLVMVQQPTGSVTGVTAVVRNLYSNTGDSRVHGFSVWILAADGSTVVDPDAVNFELRIAVIGFGNWT